jgi:hypothetical protein
LKYIQHKERVKHLKQLLIAEENTMSDMLGQVSRCKEERIKREQILRSSISPKEMESEEVIFDGCKMKLDEGLTVTGKSRKIKKYYNQYYRPTKSYATIIKEEILLFIF